MLAKAYHSPCALFAARVLVLAGYHQLHRLEMWECIRGDNLQLGHDDYVLVIKLFWHIGNIQRYYLQLVKVWYN